MRKGLSANAVNTARKLFDEYTARNWRKSATLRFFNFDNLNKTSRVKHARIVDGEVVTSHMLNALITEEIDTPPEVYEGAGPPPTNRLLNQPFEYDLSEFAMPLQELTEWLEPTWRKCLQDVANDVMKLLERPDASLDQHEYGKTVHRSLEVIVDVNGSSTEDVATWMRWKDEKYGAEPSLDMGDYATFRGVWENVMINPNEFSHHCPLPCELHLEFHYTHAAGLIWYSDILRPSAVLAFRPDIRSTYEADNHNNKEQIMRMLTVANFDFLLALKIPEELLNSPTLLMEKVKGNVPLWDLIGFAFYYGCFATQAKQATRCTDTENMDKAWQWMLISALACNKTHYSRYACMVAHVRHDSHPWVQATLTKFRTYHETTNKSSGRGFGTLIEKVR